MHMEFECDELKEGENLADLGVDVKIDLKKKDWNILAQNTDQ